MKELRNIGDEVAKQVGVRGGDMSRVSSDKRGFEELMKLVGPCSGRGNLWVGLAGYWLCICSG